MYSPALTELCLLMEQSLFIKLKYSLPGKLLFTNGSFSLYLAFKTECLKGEGGKKVDIHSSCPFHTGPLGRSRDAERKSKSLYHPIQSLLQCNSAYMGTEVIETDEDEDQSQR